MAGHQIGDIRNLTLVGHSAAGKTTLGEAALLKTGVTNRLGNVEDGTSMLDHDDESRERKHSVDSSVFYVEHNGKLINLVDTPGMPDYCGPALASLAAADTAVVVVSAAGGIGVNTRRMFNAAKDYGLACMVVITRIDAETTSIEDVFNAVQETFGHRCQPINLPADRGKSVVDLLQESEGASDVLDVATCHTSLVEAIVETDEALMEAYMDTGSAPPEKLMPAIAQAVAAGDLIPVLFTNSRAGVGIGELLDAVAAFAPSPAAGRRRRLVVGEGEEQTETEIEPKPDGDFAAQVFKITLDPKSNIKYSVARVLSGLLKPDDQVFAAGDRKGQRPGHLFKLCGNQHAEVPDAQAGDIIAFSKLDLHIGGALFGSARDGNIPMPRVPTPMFALALEPKARGDVEKIGGALQRFAEEDPCFKYLRDTDTGELVMQGLGDQHLSVVQSKMRRYFKLEVDTKPPKIPYRETITGSVKYVEYTHKKQTGGAGQFARVFIDMEPNQRGAGYEFVDKIFGGAIDQGFRPSVDKGIKDQIKRGVVAGYPVVDVTVRLVDGKTHPVDSKDIAFQIAGREVFKRAFTQCRPVLLEPIVNIEITVPTENVGDIARDLSGKRGQIIGQDMLPGNQACIRGTVPLAEVANYSSQLKSVTGGQGSYVMEFSHYDEVPANVQQQIVAAHKTKGEED